MAALDLIDGWPVPAARAAVLGGPDRGVLAKRGDSALPGRWASVTKLVTTLTVLVAVEEEVLGFGEPCGPPGSTIRHLLAHASGLAFEGGGIRAGPGQRRIYSNAGFEALGTALARRTGMSFGEYLAEAVLLPLGMSGTNLEGSAAAGLAGPLDDLVRLAAELLAPTLISARTLDAAATVAFPGLAGVLPGFGPQRPLDWGLGFEVRDDKFPHWTGRRNSPGTFGHFGASGSFLWVDRAAGLACTALSGRDFGPWAAEAWPTLADAVLHEHAGPAPPG